MRRKQTLNSVVLSLALQVFFGSALAERPTLEIASFSFPPILHEDETGRFSGTMGETVRYMCEEAGVTCNFHIVPLKRAYHYLRDGKMDALITIDFGQLKECCLASTWASPWSAGLYSQERLNWVPKRQSDMFDRNLIVVKGMRSPYLFMPDLDSMEKDNTIGLHKATNIRTAVRMFVNRRAPLMWGSDEFEWYFDKQAPRHPRFFTPVITKNVVVWIRKEEQSTLERLDKARSRLRKRGVLDEKDLLIPDLMSRRYREAPYLSE